VCTLGLGTGVTAAIVAVVDHVILRALPYPDAHELVTVWNTYPAWRGHEVLDRLWDRIHLSYPEYRDWRDGQRSFRAVAIYSTGEATLTGIGDPARIGFGAASPSLFPMLGVRTLSGRTFSESEAGGSGDRVAVVSHGFWVGRLGSAPELSDQAVIVDGIRYSVIGVLPPGFRVHSHTGLTTASPDVWVPAGIFGDANDRGWHRYEGIARLRPGVSLELAAVETQRLLGGGADELRRGARVLPRQAEETARARGPLMLLLGAAALLLAISAVNVATLLTADAARRRHEFATRRALGAGRAQLIGQLASEGSAIGLLGAIVGVMVAVAGVPVLLALAPEGLGLPAQVQIGFRVLLATTTFSIGAGVLFGVGAGLLLSHLDSRTSLTLRTMSSDRVSARVQHALIAVEAALAIVLVVGAGLLGRSLMHLESVDPGFSRRDLVAMSIPLAAPGTESADVVGSVRELVAQVSAIPGVEHATAASTVPFSGEGGSSSFQIEGRPVPAGEKSPEAHRINAMPGFHEILGIPIVAGRTFTESDQFLERDVIVVSETLARRYWPGASPIGTYVIRDDRRWQIIGVVRDVLLSDLSGSHQSTFYFPFWREPSSSFWVIVRSPLPTEAIIPSVRAVVQRVASGAAVAQVARLDALVGESTAPARYRAILVAVFGSCSVLLAAVGIFGLTARMVTARRRELGIRAALGAQRAQITLSVMSSEARALVVGIAAGLLLAVAAVRSLESFLFDIAPLDLPTFAAAALALGAIGLLACYLPARWMAEGNPTEVLRAD
jgi:putative ABC transport system permease protein